MDWIADLFLPAWILCWVVLAFTKFRAAAPTWSGLSRFLGTACLSGLAGVPLNIMVGTAIDPTSHNLAPIEFIVWSGAFLLGWLLVWALHAFFRWLQPD